MGQGVRELFGMQHAGDFARRLVQIGQQQIGLPGAAVDRGGTTGIGQGDGLVPPIGEPIGPDVAQRLQQGNERKGLLAGRPRG